MTPLPTRLRQLADQMNNTDGRTRTQRDAEQILHAAITLWHDGDTAANRAHQWNANGYPTGSSGPSPKGSHGDSTANAGTNDTDHPETRYHHRLTLLRAWLVDNATDLTQLLNAILTTNPRTGRPTTVDECAEAHCHDPAPKPRRGRCEPCARWRQRWLDSHPASTWIDVPPVPPTVIEERRIRRRRVTPTEPA